MLHRDKKPRPSMTAISTHPRVGRPCIADTSEWPSFPIFTAVRLVCRECLDADGTGSLLRVVDTFLDNLSGTWTLSTGYKNSNGSLRLLQYLVARESKTLDPFLRRWEVNCVTGEMAARGDLQGLKWVTEKYLPGEFLTEVVAQATCNGHLDILKFLWENHRGVGYWGGIELVGAIKNHNRELVDWLRIHVDLRPECAQHVIKHAAGYGNLEVVRWLCEHFNVGIAEAMSTAASNCQWEVLRWLVTTQVVESHNLDPALHDTNLYWSPAHHGNLDMIIFLFECNLVQDPVEVFQTAAARGHLHIIKWLYEDKGILNTGDAFYFAAENGHLDVLKYLNEKEQRADSYHVALNAAAGSGSLETVQWLHYNTRAGCTYRAMDVAAGMGHLELVQWLHDTRTEGCSALAMYYAARNGHLETVKWLHSNRSEGCHVLTMKRVAERGNLEMIKWLHANRHETFNLDGVMDAAAALGDLRILQWFHENRDEGCSTFAMDQAAENGHLEVVKWLHEHRTEGCTQRAMNDAAINGHLEVVKWLHLNRSEGCTTLAIDGAAGNSHLKVVKWLRCHRSLGCTPLALELLFSKSRRLDTAVFLFSEFPECRTFHLGPVFEVAWVEIVQWLLERAPSALEGCILRVKAWNWHVCEWLEQTNWRRVSTDSIFSFWERS
ncbi:hypothetical protein F444_21268 [Phytophthora nicotianae P1976]|uniref:Uncharacterized protein n=1 Tax=Phytophthora nicotianae P1976 TaxID=1317066 RepID=A0A080Z1Q3_PHYNI|nr:hypothetical protein F444_21268 [Phytophthora nicotianae P1976]